MNEKMLDIAIYVYNNYTGSDLKYATSILSKDYEESLKTLDKAYNDEVKDFKNRLLEPASSQSETVSINYSAAFEEAALNKVKEMQLQKHARRATIAKDLLNQMK
ncbi:hypothetical protein [Apilactobacillus xinyiensis]|uniref:Phage protein n=1 Tax=Apilactobacillus xinyiensis TaxID=2841032 RepID=A0ABT0I0A4_9LACO|nr:hypothetical protein [Apilactobacillus xinyiensis]MCK8624258.1 hypothetical protein [Apilactobacillus xinyiensis]MCL0311850.1 hypothetical protein [Apilactobacillus xinyiensis]MCL0318476.1 hypothetical protein [Apilactobacillus xinyiensis]MCL0329535.1 hypothetical protein [Apilactobacillus xinyiensis]